MPIIEATAAWEQSPLSETTALFKELKVAVASIVELEIRIDQVSCIFTAPYMCEEHEILVHVKGLFIKSWRTDEVRQKLAEVIRDTIHRRFPDHFVEVFIEPFDEKNGFAMSTRRR